MKKIVKRLSILLSLLCVSIFSLISLGELFIPDKVVFYDGQTEKDIYKIYRVKETDTDVITVSTAEGETHSADVSILGLIPVKQIAAEKSERRYVHVGGDIIGIRLYTEGLLVVGIEEVAGQDGNINPAEIAGIKSGDVILEVNGTQVFSVSEFSSKIIDSDGKSVDVTIIRNNKKIVVTITPVYSVSEGKYRCGLWLRDSTAGIGTLTFADPENSMFASLGHAICDNETKSVLPVGQGDILTAEISGLIRGEKGITGQIKGNFGNKILGTLYDNNEFGVYGTYSDSEILYGELLPVASQTEIETGDAKILCNVDGNGIEAYEIEIEKITYSGTKTSRSMVLKVADEELIAKTGGIIQGMSGSPIIQNGMLIGAVTHVFLNDPTRGYGIFIENMIETAQQISDENINMAS